MTQAGPSPQIGYREDEALGVYTNTQGGLRDQRQALPDHDPSGIGDPAISSALRDHNDKTKSSIDTTDDTLGKGKRAVSDLADTDRASAARARQIDPGGLAALRDALNRPVGPASPLAAPTAEQAPAPAMTAPAPAPAMPPAPQLAPDMVNIAPDALAKLLAGADLSGADPAGRSGDFGPAGGHQPLSISGIDFRQTGLNAPLTKSQLVAVIDKALDNNGISRDPQVRAHWRDIMYNQGMRESSGVPDAVNHEDSNAVGPIQADGARLNCSRGLWQTTAETFARYHVGGTSNNIYDPVANASASVAYQMAGHGIGADGNGLAHYHAQRAAAGYGAY
ncbi:MULTISPECIES: transglycosylase SLT domain-containing protein [Mycobacterium]|uniref:Transglycosylase SLT domain-containing protein n=1 Tax=Mycobacterium kyorinense TaxID=487514 RepID=A0A1X1XMR6_9MYCO|nr:MULTISPECIES: transglycosylase SLT domain-containing protein [Mycobacterium]ORW00148.1 hypothetical protein AWC14_00575 [Mycobacterium kyorinense]